jgi:glycine dehydrogenase subunit 1
VQFAPHTDHDVTHMLERIGVGSLDALFDHLPADLRPREPADLPPGRSEDEVLAHLADLAARNDTAAVCFAGGGAYDHYVPAVVGAVLSRGELLTAYTPYQPEMSQGMLQALFEYQTVVSELTGLPISNASLYDGGSAVAEAVSMACAATRRDRVLVSTALDAPSRRVVATYGHPVRRQIEPLAIDPGTGQTVSPGADGAPVAAVVVSQPNHLGVIEDVRAHADAAHALGAQLVVKLDPTVTGIVARPGHQGADLVIGEGQSLGQGLTYGGPTFGFLACTEQQVRRVPGRMVGRTADVHGVTGYVMTLRAREQDIRRERATSNICTNQTLNAVGALVYATWLGPQGLAELAAACLARAHGAADRLTAIEGATLAVSGPFFKEFALDLGRVDPDEVVRRVQQGGYLIGPVVDVTVDRRAVLVATTERRTAAEVEGLAQTLETVLKELT